MNDFVRCSNGTVSDGNFRNEAMSRSLYYDFSEVCEEFSEIFDLLELVAAERNPMKPMAQSLAIETNSGLEAPVFQTRIKFMTSDKIAIAETA